MAENIAYNIDCMEFMRTLPDMAFDLAIVDPIYGAVKCGYSNDSQSTSRLAHAKKYHEEIWQQPKTGKDYFDELFRISKNQIIWGGNFFCEEIRRNSSCWLVWDKVNGTNQYADCELAWTSFPGAVRRFQYRWAGMLQENMKNKEARIHPTQKPVALYTWVMQLFSKPGYRIIDTHLGSGSSRIAAYELGIDFVGCEISETYFRLQNERYAKHIAQGSLFKESKDG